MVKALVHGGTGSLGSHIPRKLIDTGHTARILRRPDSPLDLVSDLPVEHVIGDVLDTDSLDRAMQGCDWVFHVAAVSDYWRSNRIKLYLVNVNGTAYVLNAARRAGIQRVIFTSSAAAVGFRQDGLSSDETIPFNLPPGEFPYGHSKYLAEQEVHRAVASGQDAVILNPTMVFGPGDLNQISGSSVVELARGNVPIYPVGGVTVIDVRDVAAAHLAAAERGRTGERYLLGTLDVSHKASMKLTAAIVGVPAPSIPVIAPIVPVVAFGAGLIRRAGIKLPIDEHQIRLSRRNLFYNCQKSWQELGKPQIDLRQSLEDTYNWYVEHGIIRRPGISAVSQ